MFKSILSRFDILWMPLIHPERYNSSPPPDTPAVYHSKNTRLIHKPTSSRSQAGTHTQTSLGLGRSFYGLKPYTPGDDCRLLDWSVYARSRHPHIRQYYQETTPVVWWVVLDSPAWQTGHQAPLWSYVAPCMAQVHQWLEHPKTGLWWLAENGWFSQPATKSDTLLTLFQQGMTVQPPLTSYGQSRRVIPETAFNRDMWIVLAPFQHPRLPEVWNAWPVPRHRLWVWEWADPWWERWTPALSGMRITLPTTHTTVSVQGITGKPSLTPRHPNHLIMDVSRPLAPQLNRFALALQAANHMS